MANFIQCDGVNAVNIDHVAYIRVYKDSNEKFLIAFHGNFPNRDGAPSHLGTKLFETAEERNEFLAENLGLQGTWDDVVPTQRDDRREGSREFPGKR